MIEMLEKQISPAGSSRFSCSTSRRLVAGLQRSRLLFKLPFVKSNDKPTAKGTYTNFSLSCIAAPPPDVRKVYDSEARRSILLGYAHRLFGS